MANGSSTLTGRIWRKMRRTIPNMPEPIRRDAMYVFLIVSNVWREAKYSFFFVQSSNTESVPPFQTVKIIINHHRHFSHVPA